MRKKVICGLVLCAAALTSSCSSRQTISADSNSSINYEEPNSWANDPLLDSQAVDQYRDIYKGVNSAEEILSEEGTEYFDKLIQHTLDELSEQDQENGGEGNVDSADRESLTHIVINDTRIYPAKDGLFAMYGLRLGAALNITWYEIRYITAEEESTIYSGNHLEYIHAISDGEKLYLLWNDGELSTMTASGEIKSLCKAAPPNAEAKFLGEISTLTGSGSEITAEIAFVNESEDGMTGIKSRMVYDLETDSVTSNEQIELTEI